MPDRLRAKPDGIGKSAEFFAFVMAAGAGEGPVGSSSKSQCSCDPWISVAKFLNRDSISSPRARTLNHFPGIAFKP